jgi:glycosyltransferase involved in cell wall biosynthesis
MRRVAVVTTFVDLLEAFSLCRVVESQVKSLLAGGYYTTFVSCDGFRPRGAFANPLLRHWKLPVYPVMNEEIVSEKPGEFRAAVEGIKEKLAPLLNEIDVVITHDIVFHHHYLAYNVACRELADQYPRVRWLHWIHSAPQARRLLPNGDPRNSRFLPFPRSLLVYPNAYDVPRVAKQFGVGEEHVRIVPHPIDFDELFNFHPLTRALINHYDLYAPAILAVYPIRMDRGKQPEKLVRLFAELKQMDLSVRLVIASFHSTGQNFLDYCKEIEREMKELGLSDDEIIFTNRLESLGELPDDELRRYRVEMPHKVVVDLFHLSNIYVHPSASETYSLVCQEAAACGNLLYLNDDFPPMRDLYGPAATYIKFSSAVFTTTYRPSELAYYADIARKIAHAVQYEKTIQQRTRLRQTRNLGYVFKTYLEPLLYA